MSKVKSSKVQIEDCYLACLEPYWKGLYGEVRRHVFAALNLAKEPYTEFLLYRLWIQAAAKDEDLTAISQIKDHLNKLAFAIPDNRDLYFSLVAIAHFELGELEAVRLMIDSLDIKRKNLYQRELLYLLHQGVSDEFNWLNSYQLEDYIVFENIALAQLGVQRYDRALMISESLSDAYKDSYLNKKIQLELVKTLGNGSDICELSSDLLTVFPENFEFRFIYSLGLFKNGQYSQAIQNLQNDSLKRHNQNYKSLTLMGHCYVKLFQEKHNIEDFEIGLKFLNHAMELGREQRFPIDIASKLRVGLLNMKGNKVDYSGRLWLAKLNPHSFSNLRTKSSDEIKFIRRPLGATARKGDLCFLIYEDKQSSEHNIWRLCALYKVIEDAEWDPICRYQNQLQLEFRHEIAVPLNIQVDDQSIVTKFDADDPRKYGVYEMDQSAFDIIIQNVCDTLGVEDQFTKVLTQMRPA